MKKRRSSSEISQIMRRVGSRNTGPEQAFRRSLRENGIKYRSNCKRLPGKPDFVLPANKVAIFVDGDFWHGNQWKLRKLKSLDSQFSTKEQKDYWVPKITRNIKRDCAVTKELLDSGWKVLRFWESDINNRLAWCLDMVWCAVKTAGRTRLSVVPEKTVAEFFAGIGLMRMGLEAKGWTVTFANDLDPNKREMYAANFADAAGRLAPDDVHRIDVRSIPTVSLATASFPCNDLSLAGSRCGLKGKQSSAFWGFVKVLKELGERRPPIVLLENVTGFLTSNEGEDFANALRALCDLGYAVDAFILDAARFVPQSRQRLFVVASSDTSDGFFASDRTLRLYESDVRPAALADFILNHSQINWRIRDLPQPPALKKQLVDVLDDVPDEDEQWWAQHRNQYLFNQMSERHRKIIEKMIRAKRWSYGTVFRRVRNGKSMAELRTDGVAGCLRTPRGGSGRQILVKAGFGTFKARLLNPRECARLMGADNYVINVPLNQALFGFGDAVCVQVVEWIAENYLNPLVNEMMRAGVLSK